LSVHGRCVVPRKAASMSLSPPAHRRSSGGSVEGGPQPSAPSSAAERPARLSSARSGPRGGMKLGAAARRQAADAQPLLPPPTAPPGMPGDSKKDEEWGGDDEVRTACSALHPCRSADCKWHALPAAGFVGRGTRIPSADSNPGCSNFYHHGPALCVYICRSGVRAPGAAAKPALSLALQQRALTTPRCRPRCVGGTTSALSLQHSPLCRGGGAPGRCCGCLPPPP
jgi:hypothetical protein